MDGIACHASTLALGLQLADSCFTLPQLDELLQRFIELDRLLPSLHLVIPIPNIHRFCREFVLPDHCNPLREQGVRCKWKRLTHDEVPLGGLSVPDLLVQRVIRKIRLGEETLVPECLGDSDGVILERRCDGDDNDLPRGQPERPEAVSA